MELGYITWKFRTTQPPTPLQQKRQGSPLQQRNVKQRTTTITDDVTTMNAATDVAGTSETTTPANATAQPNAAISNAHFAKFKNLRKLNSKAITAKHHLEFLQSLKGKKLSTQGITSQSSQYWIGTASRPI